MVEENKVKKELKIIEKDRLFPGIRRRILTRVTSTIDNILFISKEVAALRIHVLQKVHGRATPPAVSWQFNNYLTTDKHF